MKNKLKLGRGLKILIACLLVAGILMGGIFGWYSYTQSRISVNVVPVSDVAMTWYQPPQSMTDGFVTSDVTQSVYISPTDAVQELLVHDGQQVSVGTPLLVFDTTLLALKAEIEELNISIAQNKIKSKETEINKFKNQYSSIIGNYNPLSVAPTVPDTSAALGRDSSSRPRPLAAVVRPAAKDGDPDTEPPEIPEAIDNLTKDSEPYDGGGTKDDPYLYFIRSDATVGGDFIQDILTREKSETLYISLEMREGDVFEGKLICVWEMTFFTDGSYKFKILLGDELEPPSPPPEESPEPPDISIPPLPPGPGYTADEIRQMYRDMVFELNGMRLDLKQKELDHKSTAQLLTDGTVYATIDGTITGLTDVYEAQLYGMPLFTISGGDGCFVEGRMSEFDLDTFELGQEVGIYNWYTGSQLTGTIAEIGHLPVTNYYYYGWGSNTNVSYYPFKVYVPAGSDLMVGYNVQLDLSASAADQGNQIYLEKPFILQDKDGGAYVFVRDENDRIEKRPVKLGRLVWGSYYQILSGVSLNDDIAFAYDKNAKPGVKAKVVDTSTFYGW